MSSLVDLGQLGGKIYSPTWRPGGGGVHVAISPASGEKIAEVGVAGLRDVSLAGIASKESAPAWARTAASERSAVLRRAAAVLDENVAEIAGWLIHESGSTRGKALYEIGLTRDELNAAAGIPDRPCGELLPSDGGRISFAQQVPVGTVAVITPSNAPLYLAMRSVAPALALGNAVVLKPDLDTAVCGGTLVARIFEEAALPAGLLHVLPGDTEIGAALVTNPNNQVVVFTGSSGTGRKVASLASPLLKRLVLELGGNNPYIVLDDADVAAAAAAGAWGSFLHSGQICMAIGRHLVHERVVDQYSELLSARASALRLGDPSDEQTDLGPLINGNQLRRVQDIVNSSVKMGAAALATGSVSGLFYPATVLGGVTPEMPAFAEEIFGPVAAITTFSSDDEAVYLANHTEYGLVAAVQAGSMSRGTAIARRLRAGMIHVNDQTVEDSAHIPMGGIGASGNGARQGGQWSVREFTYTQWFTIRDEIPKYPS